ncbi:putative membrane protein, partial [Vibrio cholerae HC-02C1]
MTKKAADSAAFL